MARQKGIIKLKGTIGDITFTRLRKTGTLPSRREELKKAGVIQRSRERVRIEFGRAGKAGKMLRTALRAY
jgi:hypothetical protein